MRGPHRPPLGAGPVHPGALYFCSSHATFSSASCHRYASASGRASRVLLLNSCGNRPPPTVLCLPLPPPHPPTHGSGLCSVKIPHAPFLGQGAQVPQHPAVQPWRVKHAASHGGLYGQLSGSHGAGRVWQAGVGRRAACTRGVRGSGALRVQAKCRLRHARPALSAATSCCSLATSCRKRRFSPTTSVFKL